MVNKERVEKIAAGIVDTNLNQTDLLISDIDTTDKMPSWDGEVRVYKQNAQNKAYLRGRVPVQVKGHFFNLSKNNNKFPDKIKYSVETSDLTNYLNDAGVMYFVVYIDISNYCNYKIYFNDFLPYSLASILKKAQKKTFSVDFNSFPTGKTERTDIFLNFLNHRKHQINLVQTDLPDEAVLKENGIIKSYVIKGTSCEEPENLSDLLFSPGKKFIYGDTKELGLGLIPLGEASNIKISQRLSKTVSISNKVYYPEMVWERDKSGMFYLFGNNIKIHITTDNIATVLYNNKGLLQERINDLEFLKAFSKTNTLEIDGKTYPFNDKEKVEENLIEQDETYLLNLKKIEQLLELLGIIDFFNFDLSELTEEENYKIQMLIEGLLEYHPLIFENHNENAFLFNFEIHNIIIPILAITDQNGKYFIYDFLNIDTKHFLFNVNDEPASRYVFLKARHFLKSYNIHYKAMLKDIKSFPLTQEYSNEITKTILEMLSAYDQQEIKQSELLETAVELAQYIYDDDPNNIFLLNYMQAMKRKRALNSQEKDQILSIINIDNGNFQEKIGASILLNDFKQAKTLYKQLSLDEQKEFDRFPITNLWKR
uniref:DUF4365 domain-containing protein n=1 Tax=uncultured Alphaproteobacteria bacterium TaxID=91750 RepID=A0A6G8F2H3_9PROT|nr:hypothetical protein PlAlph_3590 [uncultured Alphaproteobacteria bacterium]